MDVTIDGVPQKLYRYDVDDIPVNAAVDVPPSSNWAFDHVADLDAHTLDHDEILRTGEYIVNRQWSCVGAGVALVANTLYAVPQVVTRDITVDRIGVRITGPVGGSNIRLGIYQNGANLYPGALLLDCGVVSGAGAAVVSVVINQQLVKGIYHLALVSDNTPTLRFNSQGWNNYGIDTADPAQGQEYWSVAFVYAALPTPFTAGGVLAGAASLPSIFLRLLTLD